MPNTWLLYGLFCREAGIPLVQIYFDTGNGLQQCTVFGAVRSLELFRGFKPKTTKRCRRKHQIRAEVCCAVNKTEIKISFIWAWWFNSPILLLSQIVCNKFASSFFYVCGALKGGNRGERQRFSLFALFKCVTGVAGAQQSRLTVEMFTFNGSCFRVLHKSLLSSWFHLEPF